jgi:hypothetical protein
MVIGSARETSVIGYVSATVVNGLMTLNIGRYGTAAGGIGDDASAELGGMSLTGFATFAGTQVSGELERSGCPCIVNLNKRTTGR